MNRQNIEEILSKAIKKAIDNGWECKEGLRIYDDELFLEDKLYYCMIFNHDFAKALWGEDKIPIYGNSKPFDDEVTNREIAWQYHLQQMVIADDPIAYLGDNL